MTQLRITDEVLAAIRAGIKDAMPTRAEICDAIKEGVADGVYAPGVSAAIAEAVLKAFPYESQILDAIYGATLRAQSE